ncbi:hypothetical protein FRACYDRAFT_237703 [Fragilariopsis cylindrus CCMP1102]|uniref:DUF676 domain-containing protein n=1 Tax=Fragilariopsis cylindrus CCMP1102 TaxID=635003 RepID=A0A1E7FGN4_9STRA|nr:hypothetical protein FRACYDRAFT_237703 [Fragilariopsis cylindrus CCMP1102]|eukprot:OEU17294.1 hypothetical protein FRACYDRAFT_237703 [Fragilariopsis cylindrus CCMP1102]
MIRPIVGLLPKTRKSAPQRMTRRILLRFLFLIVTLVVTVSTATAAESIAEQQCSSKNKTTNNYYHLVVLVHGYLGSDREQDYLSEALIEKSKKSIQELLLSNSNSYNKNDIEDGSCINQNQNKHQFVILSSKANVNNSTDGIAKGGERLAVEISAWIQQYTADIQEHSSSNSNSNSNSNSTETIVTLSLIGNSLGGLYSRYALAELYYNTKSFDKILPLIFGTTSSPHLGVSQETFIELPKWVEPYVATVMQQQSMDDLFSSNNSTVVMDMCRRPHSDDEDDNNNRDYLHPLQQFQKRIVVANAYNTDFLVSVSSGAFLSSNSNSVHYHQDPDYDDTTCTTCTTGTGTGTDELGWHKIFVDTRDVLPSWLQLSTPELVRQVSYTSNELQAQFKRYGTLLPIAHPLNMANAKTDLYRQLTKAGQPIMDALAELLIIDMIELSEKHSESQEQQQQQ